MKGLPPKTLPLRVVVQGEGSLIHALSDETERMILSPVETNLEISARVTQADVVVVDVSQNPAKGLGDIRDLTFDRPVLALVAPGQVAEALAAGASGAVRRDSKPTAIAAAIAAVAEGLAVVDAAYLEAPPAPAAKVEPAASAAVPANDVLTRREGEVLRLMADGLSNKQIAAQLSISEHTAKFHVNSILQKMNAQKRVEAVVKASKLGLIAL